MDVSPEPEESGLRQLLLSRVVELELRLARQGQQLAAQVRAAELLAAQNAALDARVATLERGQASLVQHVQADAASTLQGMAAMVQRLERQKQQQQQQQGRQVQVPVQDSAAAETDANADADIDIDIDAEAEAEAEAPPPPPHSPSPSEQQAEAALQAEAARRAQAQEQAQAQERRKQAANSAASELQHVARIRIAKATARALGR